MNILDKLATIPALSGAFLGVLPAKPDGCLCLFEYPGNPPDQHFSGTDIIHSIQVRARDTTAAKAYMRAEAAVNILNRYHDTDISVLQSTTILDIGVDTNNPPRHEYTVNFKIRRL